MGVAMIEQYNVIIETKRDHVLLGSILSTLIGWCVPLENFSKHLIVIEHDIDIFGG